MDVVELGNVIRTTVENMLDGKHPRQTLSDEEWMDAIEEIPV